MGGVPIQVRPDIPLKSEKPGDALLRVDVIKTFRGRSGDMESHEFSLEAQVFGRAGNHDAVRGFGLRQDDHCWTASRASYTPDSGEIELGDEYAILIRRRE